VPVEEVDDSPQAARVAINAQTAKRSSTLFSPIDFLTNIFRQIDLHRG
jgi:hypothetical protein